MAGLKQISNLFRNAGVKCDVWYNCGRMKNIRLLSYVSKEYDEKNDPTQHFFNKSVQKFLLQLTRTDLQKIFRKRGVGKLEDPKYEFLTDEQLREKLDSIKEKSLRLLQFPPAVAVRKPKDKVFSRDPALIGYETSKLVFTDITYGLKDKARLIAIRDPDGTLREADWATRDRINQVYFPRNHRQLKVPQLFKDGYFEDLLNRREYIFVLDLACQQFEPDDPEYQRIVSVTYQHINDHNAFEILRSTRHFGSMLFFLVWNKMVDNLLLDLIDTCYVDEARLLIELYGIIHKVQFTKTDNVELLEEFIKNHSNKKAILELALQATKDYLKEKEIVTQGIKKAHGHG